MAYEVQNCSLTATDIELPFAMAGHSCAVNKDKLYVCSSEFDAMDLNCTVFDGKSFSPMGMLQTVCASYETDEKF